MSGLTNVLRLITKKASHPNSLIHQVQLERARKKYLVQGQLDDGKEGAVALGAPEEEGQEQSNAALEVEKVNGSEVSERDGEKVKGKAENDRDRVDEEDTGESKK